MVYNDPLIRYIGVYHPAKDRENNNKLVNEQVVKITCP